MAQPLTATPRTSSRLTVGHEVSQIADQFGTPFMPWQRDLAAVANEIRPDGKGFAYKYVVCIVPRRAGKTLLAFTHAVHRAREIDRGFVWATSHSQAAARDMMLIEWLPMLEGADDIPHRALIGNGRESITFPQSKGRIGLFAPNRSSLHGKNSDFIFIDEAFKFSSDAGKEILAGIGPTTLTRPWSQVWIVSAAGDQHSSWLLDWRERGRKQGEATDTGLCYLEFHPPLDAYGNIAVDLEDPAVWAAVHPAVGQTIDLDVLKADRAADDAKNFHRSILSVFDAAPEINATGLFDPDAWSGCGDESFDIGTDTGLHLSYDINPQRSHGCIVLARRLDNGGVAAELVEYQEGVSWIAPTIAQLHQKYGPKLVADGTGPASTVTRELRDLGLTVRELTYSDAQNAAAEMVDDVANNRFIHRRQGPLDAAIENVIPRRAGRAEGLLFGRRVPTVDIGPAVAVANAAYSARHTVVQAPFSVFS